jgi:hypothetical protein
MKEILLFTINAQVTQVRDGARSIDHWVTPSRKETLPFRSVTFTREMVNACPVDRQTRRFMGHGRRLANGDTQLVFACDPLVDDFITGPLKKENRELKTGLKVLRRSLEQWDDLPLWRKLWLTIRGCRPDEYSELIGG